MHEERKLWSAYSGAISIFLNTSQHPQAVISILHLRHDPLSLEVPGTELMTYGDRTFLVVIAVKAWNQLLKKIPTVETADRFKADLKTHLFEL